MRTSRPKASGCSCRSITTCRRRSRTGSIRIGFNGAAVVLEPNSGEVLGFTSRPAYDPNAFASGIDRATWTSLTTDELRPLNDRAIQGRYSPGSTFKMAVALAALEEGIITPDFHVHCAGGATFYGRPFKCWKKGGHGSIDLRHAIEQSCDVYFYTVANMVGVDKINKWATALGLGVKSGIDLPNEVTGPGAVDAVEAREDAREVVRRARRSRSGSARARWPSRRCRWRSTWRRSPTAARA